jgi:hypothetical protein
MNPSVYINKLLADTVWNSFRKKKYGLRNCGSNKHDPNTLFDLKYLHVSQLERISLGVTETAGCGLDKLEEKINTL